MKHSNCDTFLLLSRVDTSAGGLLVPEGIISQVVGVSSLKWFIRYIYYLNLNLRSKQNSENIPTQNNFPFYRNKIVLKVIHSVIMKRKFKQ